MKPLNAVITAPQWFRVRLLQSAGIACWTAWGLNSLFLSRIGWLANGGLVLAGLLAFWGAFRLRKYYTRRLRATPSRLAAHPAIAPIQRFSRPMLSY